MRIIPKLVTAIFVFLLLSAGLRAQVPQIINYQGRVVVGTVNFDGSGGFRFALVNGNGSITYWSNDGTSTAGSAPTGAVTLAVSKGLYTVLLGEPTLPNMTAVPASVFTQPDVRLRVWFNDGVHGTQLLAPDQRIAAVGYAMMAGGVTDGAITAPKLAAGSVTADKLAAGVGTGNLPWQPVTGTAQQAQPNSGYLVGAGTSSTVTLPATAAIGDVVRVSGTGAGGWIVAQNAGQTIRGPGAIQLGGTPWAARGITVSQDLGAISFASAATSADGSKIVTVASNGYIYTSADSGGTWVARMTDSNRNWTSVTSSPDGTKLAATVINGFIYTSADSGVTWTARMTDAPRNWRAIASTKGGRYLFVAESPGYVYESYDYGATWTLETHPGAQNWTAVAYSLTETAVILVAGTDSGLYKSNNFTTFIPGGIQAKTTSLAISADTTVIYGTSSAESQYPYGLGQVFASTNSGTTFSYLPGLPAGEWGAVACSADGTRVVAALRSTQPGARIFTSADSGATWVASYSDNTSRSWKALASSSDGTKLVGVSSANHYGSLFTSADSGVTWTPRGAPRPNIHWKALASAGDGTLFAADGVGGQIYHAPASGGAFYLDITTPAGNWSGVAVSSNPAKAVACVDGGRIYTADALDGWTVQPGSPVTSWSSIACSSNRAKIAAAVRGGRIYTSGDSGLTWTPQPGSPNANWAALASSSDGTKLVAVSAGGFIYTSTDSGVTWTPRATDATRNWVAVTSSASGANLAAVVNGGNVHTSADFGATWTVQPALPAGPWSSVSSSADGTLIIAAANPGLVYVSQNSGVWWMPQTAAGSQAWTAVCATPDGTACAATADGGAVYVGGGAVATGTTTAGAAGFIQGGIGSTIELQYLGNGQWQSLSHEGTISGF